MSQTESSPASAPADEVVRRSVRGAATTTLAGLLGRAAGLATTLLVTHFVHKSDYGQANLALIIATVVNALTLLAPQQALMTRRDHFEESASLLHGYLLWTGVVVFSLLAVLGKPLLGQLSEPGALPLLRLYCVALLFERLALIPSLKLRYQLRFGDLVQVDLLGDAVYVAVTIGAAVWGSGALCLPLGVLSRQVARVLALRFGQKLPVWPPLPGPVSTESRQLLGELWPMMWPIYLASLAELSTLYMDNLFVGRVYSTSAQGVYAVGYTIIMTPSETIAMYVASALVRALGLSDAELRCASFLQGLRYVSLALLPIGVGATLVAPTFEAALLPERWHGVAQVMIGLSLGAMSLGIHRMAFALLTALHRSRLAALAYALQVGCFATGLWLVAATDPDQLHMERVAQAVSVALAVAACGGLAMVLWIDSLRFSQLLVALAPPVAATALMAGMLLLLRSFTSQLGLPATVFRLGCEILLGLGSYLLGLRLLFPALFLDVRNFIARRK